MCQAHPTGTCYRAPPRNWNTHCYSPRSPLTRSGRPAGQFQGPPATLVAPWARSPPPSSAHRLGRRSLRMTADASAGAAGPVRSTLTLVRGFVDSQVGRETRTDVCECDLSQNFGKTELRFTDVNHDPDCQLETSRPSQRRNCGRNRHQ